MTTAYSNLLGLALPVTGELSGTWGDTVNDYITKYLDDAIANAQVISGSQTAVTLSKTTGTALVSAGSGSTGSAQYALIRCTGNPASTLTITVSYASLTNSQFSKTYLIFNSTSTNQSVVVQATTSSGTSTGVTIAAGERALIAWNGTDFVKIATQSGTGRFVTIEVTNIKANDGTASIVLTDSTGAVDMSKAVTMSATTQNIDLGTSQTSGTFTVGGAAQTGTQTFDQSTKTHTLNIGTGATENAATKTVNLATAGVSGSTTTMSVGSAVSGAITNLTVNATTTLAPIARSTGAVSYFTVTTPADTGLTASTEVIGSSFSAATRTWATGALTLQRERVFAAPTYAFAGASTLTTAVNVDIGLPVAGTNATITNAYALRADNTLFTGNVVLNNASAALDLTNLEVTNIKAKDGTASMTLADTTGIITLSATAGTANGVLYLNGSRAVTSGTALTFDGTTFKNKSASPYLRSENVGGTVASYVAIDGFYTVGSDLYTYAEATYNHRFFTGGTEKMRLLSGGQLNLGGNFTSTNNTLQVTGNTAIGDTLAAPTDGLYVKGSVGIGTNSPVFVASGAETGVSIKSTGVNAAGINVSSSNANNSRMEMFAAYGVNQVGFYGKGDSAFPEMVFGQVNGSTFRDRMLLDTSGTLILRQSSNAANTSVSFNTTVQNALTLNSSGNLGLGVTPSAWESNFVAMQIGPSATVNSASDGRAAITSNIFIGSGSTAKYIANGFGSAYNQLNGAHLWFTAPNNTSGPNSDASGGSTTMTLDASGNLLVGTTSLQTKITVGGFGSSVNSIWNGIAITTPAAFSGVTGNIGLYLYASNSGGSLNAFFRTKAGAGGAYDGAEIATDNRPFRILTSTTEDTDERLRVTSTGNVGIGTSSPGAKLDVSGANAGTVLASRVLNTSTSASSDAQQFIYVNSGTAGDPYTTWTVGGVTSWSAGIRNSDSDSWYLSPGGSLGTSPALTVTTSGNLGLGVTPSAWGSGYAALQIKQTALYTTATEVELGSNHFVNSSGQFAYIGNGFATRYEQYLGAHSWHTAPNNTSGAGFAPISFTQAMTLDANGDLGVGTTSIPSGGASTRNVSIHNSNSAATYFKLSNGATGNTASDGFDLVMGTSSDAYIFNRENGPMLFGTNSTERARITSGGYFKAADNGASGYNTAGTNHEFVQSQNSQCLIINATNASYSSDICSVNATRNTTNNSFYALTYYNNGAGAYKFRVADSGDVTNTNGTYGTISDAKMKTDIVDAGSQWADIKALRFRKFKMKNDPSGLVQLGVVAQEVELTSPGLVDEHADKDAEGNDLGTTTKSVKTSILLMKAAVALQEAMARIEKLEAEVAALKGA